jgi:hypothetical protein
MGALKMGTRERHGERGREEKREKGARESFAKTGVSLHLRCAGESHSSKLHRRRGAIATSPAFSNPPCPAAAKIASSPTFRGIICFCCSRIEVAAAGQSSCRLDVRGCCPPRAPICKQLAIFRLFIRYRGTL